MEKKIDMLKCKVWAIVGATDNKEKFGYKIYKFMRDAGYEAYAVNPGVEKILGQQCYKSLQDLPVKPEAVDIVVPPKVGEQIVRQCAELSIQNVWLQPGADGQEIIAAAETLRLKVVYNSCVMKEIKKQGGR